MTDRYSKTGRHTDTEAHRQADSRQYKQTDRQTDRHTHTDTQHTYPETVRQPNGLTNRQTVRQS